jgi:hypothetical protein
MTCHTERLSDYLDGELSPAERRDVDLHLAGCADCRAVLRELALVKETAADLAGDEAMPERDLWPQVAWRMQARRASISLSWPQALAAGVALMAVSSGAVWMAMRTAPEPRPPAAAAGGPRDTGPDPSAGAVPVSLPNFADEAYDNAVRDLRNTLEEGRNRLDPQTIQVLEKNLAAIDQAIDQARKALEADPANVSLSSYLASVRKRKLDMLRTASELMQPTL